MPIYPKKCSQEFSPPYTPENKNAGGSNLGSHWEPLVSLYNNHPDYHFGAFLMGVFELPNGPFQLALKLSITQKFKYLSKFIFYGKKIITILLSKL